MTQSIGRWNTAKRSTNLPVAAIGAGGTVSNRSAGFARLLDTNLRVHLRINSIRAPLCRPRRRHQHRSMGTLRRDHAANFFGSTWMTALTARIDTVPGDIVLVDRDTGGIAAGLTIIR